MARAGDSLGDRREIAALEALRQKLHESGSPYWADRTTEQILAVSAWAALADGSKEKAVGDMRRAADSEQASVKDVAMGNRLYPMRELLGDLLLEAGQPQAALHEYVLALADTPNRFRGLYGAAIAAQQSGDRASAGEYFTKLVTLAGHADASRPELERARAFVAAR
jgi:tetratricopeptide (TPR) repeat protein